MDAQAFKKLEKTIAQTIQEAERVADDAQMGMGRTMSELALQNEEEQFSGLLPVLRFGEQEEPKVDSMLLFQNDTPQGTMHGTQLGLALVAGGQTDRMQFSFYHDGGYYHVETQRLRLVKQAAQEEKGLRLHLSVWPPATKASPSCVQMCIRDRKRAAGVSARQDSHSA